MNSNVMNLGQRREDKNPEDVYDQIRQEIEGVDCGEYSMCNDEVLSIAQHCDNDFIDGSYDMFRCGFVSGIRFMKENGWKA